MRKHKSINNIDHEKKCEHSKGILGQGIPTNSSAANAMPLAEKATGEGVSALISFRSELRLSPHLQV